MCVSVSFFIYHNNPVFPCLLIFILGFLYLLGVGVTIRRRQYSYASWLMVLFYAVAATLALVTWSINAPVGILTLGFVIILAGSTLPARYIIPATAGAVSILIGVQTITSLGIVTPDSSSLDNPSTFGDVFVYGILFSIFALIAWLSRRQMEYALRRALAAEATIEHEKHLLAIRLKEKTDELRAAQLDEMQQLYRFAEIGQLSTTILHELANHLTVLTLDIDDMSHKYHQSTTVERAKESITHLESLVDRVRHQLQDYDEIAEFQVIPILQETITTLSKRSRALGITITVQNHCNKKTSLAVHGDPLCLSQVLAIIMTNALDAYESAHSLPSTPTITVAVTCTTHHVRIAITDTAGGLSDSQRSQIFTPFKTTKATGMGLGLFVGRKMIETHFKGTLKLNSHTSRGSTQFVITLPVKKR